MSKSHETKIDEIAENIGEIVKKQEESNSDKELSDRDAEGVKQAQKSISERLEVGDMISGTEEQIK